VDVLGLLVRLAVPAALFVLMVLVGLELTVADFRRVRSYPRAVGGGLAAQLLLPPAVASVLIAVFHPPEPVVTLMVVLAACPPGAVANVVAVLARADAALSVTLTAVCAVTCVVTMPLVASAGLALHLGRSARVSPPVATMMGQLVLLVLVPVALGMGLRTRHERRMPALGPWIRRLSLAAVLGIVAVSLLMQGGVLSAASVQTLLLAALFNPALLALGHAAGSLLRLPPDERATLAVQLPARSLAVSTVVTVTLLGRPDLLPIGTLFFAVQVAVLLGLVRLRRRAGERESTARAVR